MLRVTFELLPGGNEDRKRTIGLMEIANIGITGDNFGTYAVVMKKTPPFEGALRAAWKRGKVSTDDVAVNAVMAGEDDELITAMVEGHHRQRRGVYDLLFAAMRACGLDKRVPA